MVIYWEKKTKHLIGKAAVNDMINKYLKIYSVDDFTILFYQMSYKCKKLKMLYVYK